MVQYAGMDVGATAIRAAVADGSSAELAIERHRTPQDEDGSAIARAAADALVAAADAADTRPTEVSALGVGTMGPLDRQAGAIIAPPNSPGISRIPLRDVLTGVLGHDNVFVENDAVAGLIGERSAVPDSPESMVYLTLSTGIGAGVILDGHVLRGRDGNAAEVGHFVVDPTGRRTCGCGRPGHWEAYCAGAAVPGYARDLAVDEGVTTGLDLDDPALSAADVFAAAGDDRLADQVVERIGEYNAIGVADIVHAYAPERIAVGGAVALENPSLVIDPLPDAVAEHAMLPVPEIRATAHGRDAVLHGALTLAAQGGLDG